MNYNLIRKRWLNMKKKKWAIIIPVIVGVLLIAGVLVRLLLPKKSEKEVLTSAIKQSFL